jgi:hypothetical protein
MSAHAGRTVIVNRKAKSNKAGLVNTAPTKVPRRATQEGYGLRSLPELARGQQVGNPLLNLLDLNVETRADDTAL